MGFCRGIAEMDLAWENTVKENEVVLSQKLYCINHKISDDFHSVFLAFTDDFKCELFNDLRKYLIHYLFKQKFPSVVLDEIEMKQIMEYYNLMWSVVKNVPGDYNKDIVKHLLSSLLINLHCYGYRDKEKAAPMSRKKSRGIVLSLLFEHDKVAKDYIFMP